MVPGTGIEPVRPSGREMLSLLRLPISPSGRQSNLMTARDYIHPSIPPTRLARQKAQQESIARTKTKALEARGSRAFDMAQRTGLEPATPGVTGRYSNRLNYRCMSVGHLSEINHAQNPGRD